jgi:SAM-dependent methyltransferase
VSPPNPIDLNAALPSTWLSWLQSAPGRYALNWQQEQYDQAVGDIFGFHALQCALPGLDGLRANRMPHRIRACLPGEWSATLATHPSSTSSIASETNEDTLFLDAFEALPIDSESVDLLLLPHVLEFAADPHQVLREVDRVLRPEGKVIISGFNPVSIWGARQVFLKPLPKRVAPSYLPGEGQFISLPRLRDWFALLSFEVNEYRFGCFAPPCTTQAWLDRWQFIESIGDKFWPICGSVYFVTAVKRVSGVTLIGPAWRNKPLRAGVKVATSSNRYQVKLKQQHE